MKKLSLILMVAAFMACTSTPQKKIEMPYKKADFEKVWDVWPGYKLGKIQRQELMKLTRYSKYIISILHWLEENNS